MGFFDLNIPYHESDRHVADKSAVKANRLKLALKAAEFGYTGVAYNRVIKGVMSDSDRCSIPVFSLASLVKLAPALSSSVKFHRDLLNVPVSAPFRQYTRLTVVVDTPAQAAALNSGNPVLKTYDIVAVRPMNQNSLEQACQTAEVDIITIDFSEKFPFRLKQSMVQAAIKRGVYFEISYSGLIVDAQSRRQMISSVKLLVDWTRRKNLIVSSAAPSASELRGPYDVANLLFLLGLPLEHAKAAISKNCRSVVEVALRRKHYYKEAIKVEVMSSTGNMNSENSALSDWLKWDPISSGKGDLLLDDLEKLFSATSSVTNTVNSVKFASALSSLPPHGFQIKEVLSLENSTPEILDGGKKPFAVEESQAYAYGKSAEPCVPSVWHEEGQTADKIRHQCLIHLDSDIHIFSSGTVNDSTTVEEKSNLVATEKLGSLKELEACCPTSDAKLHCLHSQGNLGSNNGQALVTDDVTNIICENDTGIAQTCDDIVSEENSIHPKDTPSSNGAESAIPNSSPVDYFQVDISVEEAENETAPVNEKNSPFALSGVSSNERSGDNTHVQEKSVTSVISADVFPCEGSHNLIVKENESVSEVEPMQGDLLEQREIKDPVALHCQILGKSVAGKRRLKRRAGYQHFPSHLKRILNLRPFKKKRRKLNTF